MAEFFTINSENSNWLEELWDHGRSSSPESQHLDSDSSFFPEAEGSSPVHHQQEHYSSPSQLSGTENHSSGNNSPINYISPFAISGLPPMPTLEETPFTSETLFQGSNFPSNENQQSYIFGASNNVQINNNFNENNFNNNFQQQQNISFDEEKISLKKEEPKTRGRKKKVNNTNNNINVVQKHLTKTKKVRKNDKNTFQVCLDSENFKELTNDQLIHLSGEQIEIYVNRLRSKRRISENEEKELKEVRKSIKNREYAQNSRQKERELKQYLQNQVEQLQKENHELLQRNTQLDFENKTVKTQLEQVKTAVQRDPSILQSIQSALGSALPWLKYSSSENSHNFSATSCSASSLEGQGGRVNTKFVKRGSVLASLFIVLLTFGVAFDVNSITPSIFAKQNSPFDDSSSNANWNTGRVLLNTPEPDTWLPDWLSNFHPISNFLSSSDISTSSLTDPVFTEISCQSESNNLSLDLNNTTEDSKGL